MIAVLLYRIQIWFPLRSFSLRAFSHVSVAADGVVLVRADRRESFPIGDIRGKTATFVCPFVYVNLLCKLKKIRK
jgi:hypothetical protein